MFYTVYKITNLKNDKIYIGTHQYLIQTQVFVCILWVLSLY